jgi:hypothetical protein
MQDHGGTRPLLMNRDSDNENLDLINAEKLKRNDGASCTGSEDEVKSDEQEETFAVQNTFISPPMSAAASAKASVSPDEHRLHLRIILLLATWPGRRPRKDKMEGQRNQCNKRVP